MNAHTRPITLTPQEPVDHTRKLIGRAFNGKMKQADMLFMARALLQLSDEMHELREELRGVKLALARRTAQ